MLNINAALFRAVYSFVSNETTRYYLNGVFVTPAEEGVLMVATDGHMMAVAHDPLGVCPENGIILQTPKNKKPANNCKPNAKEGIARRIVWDGRGIATIQRAFIEDGKLDPPEPAYVIDSLLLSEIDAQYPDFWRVVPREIDEDTGVSCMGTGGFNPAYVKKLGDFGIELAAANYGAKTVPMSIKANSERDPHLVTYEDVPAFAVIMPLRYTPEKSMKTPAWFAAPTPAKQKEAA